MWFIAVLILGGVFVGMMALVLWSCLIIATQADERMNKSWGERATQEKASESPVALDDEPNHAVFGIAINFPARLTSFEPSIHDLVSGVIDGCSNNFVLPAETPVVSAMPEGQKQTRHKAKGSMQKISKLIMTMILGGLMAGSALAGSNPATHALKSRTNVPPVHGTNSSACPTNAPGSHPTNAPPELSTNAATALAAKAASFYASIAPYDLDADGTLSSTEAAAIASALTNGLVPLFGTNNPCILHPHDTTNVVAWISALYTELATFDTDHSGTLSATEQSALAAALEADTVPLPIFAPLLMGDERHASRSTHASFQRLAWTSRKNHFVPQT